MKYRKCFQIDGFVQSGDNVFDDIDCVGSLNEAKRIARTLRTEYERIAIWIEVYDDFDELIAQSVIDFECGKFSKPFKML